jgi:non-specific serine/threonine protein kinase
VADEVSRILGAGGVGDPVGSIVAFLGGARALLVLDNCEHVIEQAAGLVSRLLVECPGVSVIATSREILRIGAERVFPIEPLEAEVSGAEVRSPAVTLFLERSAGVLGEPSAADLRAIEEICRRLDGLPLAIELAAARARVLAPAQLLERLQAPLAVLTSGPRDAPDRQQTIRAAIAWSYELCTDAERALWRRMAVFPGAWDLDAAEWMSAGVARDAFAIDLVQSLVEKSVVGRCPRGGIVYYDMLDTVRQYGIEVSTEAERIAAAEALRDWYLHRLGRLDADWYGPDQVYWLAMARTELPNIRAAIEYTIATADVDRGATLLMSGWRPVWQAHGLSDELGRWGRAVLAIAEPTTPDGCQLLAMMGSLEYATGDGANGEPMLERAERLAEELDDDYCRAFILDERASIRRDAETPGMLAAALELFGGTDPLPGRRNLAMRIAVIEAAMGDPAAAARKREALIARAVIAGESYETAFLLLNTGMIASRKRDFDEAVTLLRQSLSLTQNLGDPFGLAVVQELLARVAVDSGDPVRAATLLGATDTVGGARGAASAAYPGLGPFRAGVVEAAQAAIGERAYAEAYAQGVRMTEDEGVAYALGARLAANRRADSSSARSAVLTPRESQVAALVGQGLTDRQIAERLVISRRTAEGHVASGLMKLGFTSRAQLAAWSVRERPPGP